MLSLILVLSIDTFTTFPENNAWNLIKHSKGLNHCSRETRKRIMVNSADPDQMPQNAASDQGLHCLQIHVVSHLSLGICKSHSWTYLKLKLDSSNIQCGRVYSVFNGLICIIEKKNKKYID